MIIHEELEKHIWPLKPEEYKLLEQSILEDGIRDKLITWNGFIVDGHNRYKIAKEHGLTFDTIEKEFADIEAVKDWMDANQLARRNLTRDQWEITIGRRYNREKKAVGNPHDVNSVNFTTLNTDTKLAKEYKISPKTVRNYAKIADEFERLVEERPEAAKAIADGKKNITDIRREIKKEEIIKNLEAIEVKEAKVIEGVYDVIVIDPPWPMEKIERDCRPNQSKFDYPTMDIDLIKYQLKIPHAKDCHVWIWTTQKFLPVVFEMIHFRRMTYVCTFVWHKPGGFQPVGLPQYNAEFAVYCRFGHPSFIDTKALPVCFTAPRGKHSEKPEAFYDVLRRVTAGRRLDMFSRREIEGFDSWGNEVG